MVEPSKRPSDDKASTVKTALLGSIFLGDILGFLLLGWLLDRVFGWSPVGVVTGGIVGICLGLFHLIRGITKTPDQR